VSTILVAGLGNVFLGDDGFGVEVVRRLREKLAAGELPAFADGVSVVDFGIRGMICAMRCSMAWTARF
jgi:hydrogenase maturation protease